ncbi:hypothetical protein HNQ81_000970 [Desulfoprunum benzoelyticum]|uniref:Uncharacterized protein n=1 Tax=Desulfoprunum benzoelyticum TaxID=1506996 RepID=A0A840ULS6_9BACT|nr:hypothetical protein [Desulfoprunum benzoelyticum]
MQTIGAAHTCKTLLKVTTFEVLPDYMRNSRAEEAVFTREEIVVTILEFINVVMNSCHNGDSRGFLPRYTSALSVQSLAVPLCCQQR